MSLINEKNLALIRSVYRLNCEELGALMNVTGRFVSHIERGTRKLPDKRAAMLERELAMTPEKLARLMEIYEETTLSRKGAI